jgi:hypothetical protein
MSQPNKDYLFSIDSHFHIYKQFRPDNLLDIAYKQLMNHAREVNTDREILPVLFLADNINSTGYEFFNKNAVITHQESMTAWVKDTEHQDNNSILLRKNSSEKILLVRGYQLITDENLEVLIIGRKVSASFNHQPINDIIKAHKDDCLVILPWAVGKWLGKRGQIINKMIELYGNCDFCLGDNGGRPGVWQQINQFDLAEKKGFSILRGSDPLPLRGEEKKAGSYGFSLKVNNVTELSARSVITLVQSQIDHMIEFGQQESNIRFIMNQIRLRIQK